MSIDGVWIKPTAEQAQWFNAGVDTAKEIILKQEKELAAVTSERDRLRKAAEIVLSMWDWYQDEDGNASNCFTTEKCEKQWEELRTALQLEAQRERDVLKKENVQLRHEMKNVKYLRKLVPWIIDEVQP
jgi:hypothetical protein